jgi:hypothetical protein
LCDFITLLLSPFKTRRGQEDFLPGLFSMVNG